MANLGAIGVGVDFGAVFCLYDVAAGWNITTNPIRCYEINGAYRALPKRENWRIVSGIVTDATSNPAAREVRAIDRATGAILGTTTSDAGTGAYAIAVPVASEVQVVFLDNAAGDVENDLILRTLPV
ncbi:MAG TPA: hypothetical protein DET46_06730 [Comamonadaceae bacterium]|nr:MAG: hypothetical protein A3F76_07775 [Burkholderiales bacterium RIFCSPLOWO2_12_FULL_65_40]HCE28492.1 hypothetical protein [Comamonadaceae bacterium]